MDTIKIEKPGGHAARNLPPFAGGVPNPEKSLYWWAGNTEKRSITLDIEARDGQALFHRLAAKADFVIESFKPGYLDSLGLGYAVFLCQGQDQWCAIAVFSDDEWKAFCRVNGNRAWTSDPRFSTLEARKENEDALEDFVAEWTLQQTAEDVMTLMQRAGVPAGVMQTAQDLIEHDPRMRAREFLIPLEHPILGTMGHPTPPIKLMETPTQVRTAPRLGEHVEYICKHMLGMSDTEYIELAQADLFK